MKKREPAGLNPIDKKIADLGEQLEEYNEAIKQGMKVPEYREAPSSEKIAVILGLIAASVMIGDQIFKYWPQG